MYARVAAATGWTFEYIGQYLTLPRLNALLRYWSRVPPVAEAVAAFLGIKSSSTDDRPLPQITNADIVREMNADPRKVHWISERNDG